LIGDLVAMRHATNRSIDSPQSTTNQRSKIRNL
jgi:hypothetical protein